MTNPFEGFKQRREVEEATAAKHQGKKQAEQEQAEARTREVEQRRKLMFDQYTPMVESLLASLRDAAYPTDQIITDYRVDYDGNCEEATWYIGDKFHDGIEKTTVSIQKVGVRLRYDPRGTPTDFMCYIDTDPGLTRGELLEPLERRQRRRVEGMSASLDRESLISVLTQLQLWKEEWNKGTTQDSPHPITPPSPIKKKT